MSKITRYVQTSRFPIKYERLFPGSLFRIHSEPSRNMKYSRDNTIYRRAREDEGFYSYDMDNRDKAAILLPEDMVYPMKQVRG